MYGTLNEIKTEVINCKKCVLCENRKNAVFGSGNPNAKIMFIGECPGKEEDLKGEIFIGKSGKLMHEALKGLGINKNNIYFANVIKCNTPENRTPLKGEINSCLDYLRNQVILVKPKVIVLLGNVAIKTILGEPYKVTECRGKIIEKKGIKYIPTFHPAALFRNEKNKIYFWNDIKLLKNIEI